MRNEVNKWIRSMSRDGYVVRQAANGHWLIQNPQTREWVRIPGSPSGSRWRRNAEAHLRRYYVISSTTRNAHQNP